MRFLLGVVLVGACMGPETDEPLDEPVDEVSDAVVTGPSFTLARTFVVGGGYVASAVTDGTTVYMGGSFDYIGERSGQLAVVTTDTGKRDKVITELGGGGVSAIVPDGTGGYYLGGDFRKTGAFTTRGIAHLRADGTYDPAWRFEIQGAVSTLARDSSRLYVGGSFAMVNGVARRNFVAIDLATAAVVDGTPAVSGMVRAMSLSTENHHLFLGGDFDGDGSFLIRLDLPSLTVSSWNPGAFDGGVTSLLAVGSGLYVGGGFTHIGSNARTRVASIDQSTGAVRGYNPGADGNVQAMQRLGSVLYLGGTFNTVGGQTRQGVAAVDASTGALLPMTVNLDEFHNVATLYPTANALYVGGYFRSANGAARHYAVAVNPTTGAVLPWNPHAENWVQAIVPRGSELLLGGQFISLNGSDRSNFAAIDLTTGKATSWAPMMGNERPDAYRVNTMVLRGSTIWVGGQFVSINGQPRLNLAALSTSGELLPFRADVYADDPSFDQVNSIAVTSTRLYVGGTFTSISGQPRTNLGAVDPTTGTALTWDPSFHTVNALVVAGPRLYVGGFGDKLAAYDVNGVPQPVPSVDSSISALAYDGNLVYVGGQYSVIGGQQRYGLAATVPGTTTVTSWDPAVPPFRGTYAIAASAGYVYDSAYDGLFVFSTSTGEKQTFAPRNANGGGYLVRPDRLIAYGVGEVDYVATGGIAEFLGTP